MEHDPGSGADPAPAPSMADEHPEPPESAPGMDGEAGGQAEAGERAAAPTGEPRVDAAVRGLDEVGELPVSEHPAVYERIHEQLVEVLGELHPGSQGH